MRKNLILLGMMAVGKTTLGKIVAKKQKLAFVDIDKLIEKKNRTTKVVFKIKPLLIKFLFFLGCNLSCIIYKLYLNSKNKT